MDTPNGLVTLSASAGTQYNGLFTSDILRINQHRLSVRLFRCPLTRIAADVDNDGKITFDDGETVRAYILYATPLPVPPWRFVPRFYVNPTTNHPDAKFLDDFWNNAHSDANGLEYPFNAVFNRNGKFYSYNGSSSWMTTLESIPVEQMQSSLCWSSYNYDFYGVASGDANYSGSPSSVPFAPSGEQSMTFDRVIVEQNNLRSAEERYEVKIFAVVPEDVHGYQLGVKFDEKVYQFEKVKPEKEIQKQDERNFGFLPRQTEKGELRVSWTTDYEVSKRGIPANQEFEVLSFNLKAKNGDKKIEEAVQIDEKILFGEFTGFNDVIARDKVKLILKTRLLRPDEE